MTTKSDKFARATYKHLHYPDTKKTIIGFSFETTKNNVFSVNLSGATEHNLPSITIIKDRKQIFSIWDDYWSEYYCYQDEELDKDKFTEVFKDYFSQFTDYTISNCSTTPILIDGQKMHHCLRFELTKETETGIDKHVFSIVPSFNPCSWCGSEKKIYIQYKLADYTINDFLFKSDYSVKTPITGRETYFKKKKNKTKRIVDIGDGWFTVKK